MIWRGPVWRVCSVKALLDVLKQRNEQTEIVLTGRYAPAELTDYADLVTDMQEVKHYYQKGVLSRRGIDR